MHPRSPLLIAACVAALALASCGGDDDTTSTRSVTVPTGATGTDTTDTRDVDTSDLPDAGILRDRFNEQLLGILTTTQGMSQSQAECAIEVLEDRVSDEEVREAVATAAETGQSPQDLIDEAFDAGADCAK